MNVPIAQRIAAEFAGTALLLAIVVGSGIMGESLAQGNAAIALLGNSIATGAGLYVLITVLGPNIPDVLTGSIFVEGMFSIPGLGRFFTSSALFRDYPMIMAMMLLVAVLWGATYIISDILYGLADPRMRVGGGEAR